MQGRARNAVRYKLHRSCGSIYLDRQVLLQCFQHDLLIIHIYALICRRIEYQRAFALIAPAEPLGLVIRP